MHSKDVQQQMFNYIDQWQQSDLTQKAFCQKAKLSYHIFHYWYKRYRNKSSEPASAFIKLDVSSTSVAAHAELILADGKRLLFHQPVSADYLKVLIS
jgi:ABC-type Zn uptake system ZnuABC Zn-binding protein ZnuA